MGVNVTDVRGAEITIRNNNFTVEVDGEIVFRCNRVGKVTVDDQRAPGQGARQHYFATVRTAWLSLSEDMSKLLTDPEALRRYALIKAGYCDARIIPLSSPDQAERVAAMARSLDALAVVTIEGCIVCVYTAKSQDAETMKPEEFSASRRAVIEICAEMIGVSVEQLSANAGQAA